MAVFPTAKDIYSAGDGRRLAAAQSYRVKTTREARFVESFGSAQPAGTVAGQPRHTIELTRLQVVGETGVDFHALSDFTIVIVKPDRKILFTGCQWSGVTEQAESSDPVSEKLTAVAAARLEVSL